jgi:hypothetical protein
MLTKKGVGDIEERRRRSEREEEEEEEDAKPAR